MLAKDQYQLLLESAHELLGKAIADRHNWGRMVAKEAFDGAPRFYGTDAMQWSNNIVSAAQAIAHIGKACAEPAVVVAQYYAAEAARELCSD